MAAKSGGYHFCREHERWVNTRDGTELLASLSAYISQQSAQVVDLVKDG